MNKVTMTQIAQELGVSRSLVSYAIKGKYGVSEDTKRKIILKAVEMGYFKTPHASIKVSKNIAIVIGKEFLGEESFFHRIVKGVEFSAISKKFNPKIMSISENDNVDAFISEIVDLKPSGVVVVRQLDGELEKRFKNLNFPMVFIDLIYPNSECFEVRVNNFSNMYCLTERLIEKGFDDFVFIGDISWATSFRERYNGFVTACVDHNVKYEGITRKSHSNEAFNYMETERFLKQNSGKVLVCANDSIAFMIYKIINDLGKRIPYDFSVVGFDDITCASSMTPPLTTMHIPKFEMGSVAFDLLYEQLSLGKDKGRVVCLNASLIERASVLNINK